MPVTAGPITPILDTRLLEIDKLTAEIEENWPGIPLVKCLPQCMLPIMIEATGSTKRILADGPVENPTKWPILYFRGQLTPLQCIAEVELDWDVRLGVEGEWLPKELLILNKPRKRPWLTKGAERKKNDKIYEDLRHYPVDVLREFQGFAAAQSGAEKAKKARRYLKVAATKLGDVKQLTVDVVIVARRMMDAEEPLPRKRGRDEQKEERRTKARSEPAHEKVEVEAEAEMEAELKWKRNLKLKTMALKRTSEELPTKKRYK